MSNRQQGKRFVSIRPNRQHFQPILKAQISYIFKGSSKLTSGMSNRQKGDDSCLFDGIGFTNRFPVSRIANTKEKSTLAGCIGQPSEWRIGREGMAWFFAHNTKAFKGKTSNSLKEKFLSNIEKKILLSLSLGTCFMCCAVFLSLKCQHVIFLLNKFLIRTSTYRTWYSESHLGRLIGFGIIIAYPLIWFQKYFFAKGETKVNFQGHFGRSKGVDRCKRNFLAC